MASPKNMDSLTSMTEFTPLSSELRPTGNFISRLFRRNPTESSPCNTDELREPGSEGSPAVQRRASEESRQSVGSAEDVAGPLQSQRTLSSVLSRLSNILDRRSQTPQAYKDADFKQYWMPDSNCRECYECGDRFNTFRRRHHCRICGQIFCSRCCNQEVPGSIMGYTGFLRVCTYCCRVVLSYAKNPDASVGSLSEDLASLDSESLSEGGWVTTPRKKSHDGGFFSDDTLNQRSTSNDLTPTDRLSPFDVTPRPGYSTVESFQNERRVLLQDAQLQELWQHLQHPVEGVELQNHRHRLRTYPNCMVGSVIVDWLIAQDKVLSREQALVFGQALVDAHWLECVTSAEQIFRDEYALYRPGERAFGSNPIEPKPMSPKPDEPLWLEEIQASEDGNIDWLSSELEKIPSTVSAPREDSSRSVFYFDDNESKKQILHRKFKGSSVSSVDFDQDFSESHPFERYWELVTHHANHPIFSNTGSEWVISPAFSGSADDRLQRSEPGIKESSNLSCQNMTFPFDLSPRHLPHQDSGVTMSEEVIKGALVDKDLDAAPPGGWQENPDLREYDVEERATLDRISTLQKEHMNQLTTQLLQRVGLSLKWAETILPIVNDVSQIVQPNIREEGDSMDIRHYVQIKKIPGSSRNQCRIVSGVVCSKNIAHKKMRSSITDPRILLLRAPIEYQRVEQKFSSLDPQILQEHEHLRKSVGRIAELKPDILLVEKTVSRLAQAFLLDAGITLILNVKSSVLGRISRFTGADIISSIDGLVSMGALGTCPVFATHTFTLADGRSKTLMYFDHCPSNLGCTVTLRGGTLTELKKVKKILRFLIFFGYHSKLESSFLMDEFAVPPPSPEGVMFSLSDTDENNDEPLLKSDELEKEAQEKWLPLVSVTEATTTKDEDLSIFKKQKAEVTIAVDTLPLTVDTADGNLPTKPAFKSPSITTEILDQSDPLQNYQISKDDAIFVGEGDFVEEKQHMTNKFKKALEDVILSVSPLVKFSIPYLESNHGSKCILRSYFAHDLYQSPFFTDTTQRKIIDLVPQKPKNLANQTYMHVEKRETHDFVNEKITSSVTDIRLQTMMADFRARGGRLHLVPNESIQADMKAEKNSSPESEAIDCLDPERHQHIAVLFSSFSYTSVNYPSPCVSPWIVNMDFYGRNDMTLGLFLERYCFRNVYKCPSEPCDSVMVDHIRRFVHGNACLQVMLKKLDVPSENKNILMWGWCKRCKQVTPVVPMSMDTWNLSFAKFLELRFHAASYGRRGCIEPCPHSLHHDHYQYYRCKQIVASFRFSTISLREVSLPPIVLSAIKEKFSAEELAKESQAFNISGTEVFCSVSEHLHKMKQNGAIEQQIVMLNDYHKQLQNEKEIFRAEMDRIHSLVEELKSDQEVSDQITQTLCKQVHCMMIRLKHLVADCVLHWNTMILEFDQQQKKEKTRIMRPPKEGSTEAVDSSSVSSSMWFSQEEDMMEPTFFRDSQSDSAPNHSSSSKTILPAASNVSWAVGGSSVGPEAVEASSSVASRGSVGSGHGTPKSSSCDDLDEPKEFQGHSRSRSSGDGKKIIKQSSHLDFTDFDKKPSMKSLLSNFLSSQDQQVVPNPFPCDQHHLLPPSDREPVVIHDQEPSSIIAYALSSSDYDTQLEEVRQGSNHYTQAASVEVEEENEGERPKSSGRVLSFLKGNREKSPMRNRSPKKCDIDTVKYTPRLDRDSVEDSEDTNADTVSQSSSTLSIEPQRLKKPDKPLAPSPHIELEFADQTSKFYCRIYFAEPFRQLRALIFPRGEEGFIQSLSRCFTWMARGGKSGSSFCKTQDDRFILKQMSRYEVQSFLEFAPHYFKYVTKAYEKKQPTALAKILGVFRIGFQSGQTNAGLKQDLLVMENLFFNKDITQIFDLKGSMRNRLVSTSGKRVEDLVLLDENLLKLSVESPLYIRSHSKVVLNAAILADTDFLSKHLVMDYSLLVGVDEKNKELVVGIIDYIRTFTWDKKLEFVVKTTYSHLGGQGKMPTVVSPELYRSRFLEAMNSYFLLVPDKWFGVIQSDQSIDSQD